MLFPTFQFFFFFAIVFLLYWYVFRRKVQRKLLLLFASYVFYASWNIRFCLLLFTVTIINYLFGLILSREKEHNVRVVVIWVITLLNVLYLFCFKYLYDVMLFLTYLLPSIFDNNVLFPHITSSFFLPIGISYYTFKCMSYNFDIYLCKMRVGRKNFLDTLLYVSFFPQLLSGPIVNASYFFKELPKALTCDKLSYKAIELDKAMLLLMSGLFKKLILSSFLLVLICNKVFAAPSSYNTIELLLAVLAFTVSIYADFSGYSDIAIAIGLLLGFKTPNNFNRPYLSSSVSEFWRRWHISFSTWLRDYIYFPLGGSRFSIMRTTFALCFTMFIAGIWHGMKFNFLLWGILQGVALSIEKIVHEKNKLNKLDFDEDELIPQKRKSFLGFIGFIFRILLVFIFTNISWLIFKSETLKDVVIFVSSLSNIHVPITIITPFILGLIIFGLLMQVPTNSFREKLFKVYVYVPLIIKTLIFTAFIIGIYLVSMSSVPPFIYFAF
ncbi:MAG: MBOAT family O-acyltransferase [Treponema sp.]